MRDPYRDRSGTEWLTHVTSKQQRDDLSGYEEEDE